MASEQKRILLVEDDGVQQVIMARFLQRMGYTVHAVVSDGESAIESALSSDNLDLIIMDIHLGDRMDGIETMKIIREKSDVKVIYVTGNTEPYSKNRAEATRYEAFIEKPVSMEILKQAIFESFRS